MFLDLINQTDLEVRSAYQLILIFHSIKALKYRESIYIDIFTMYKFLVSNVDVVNGSCSNSGVYVMIHFPREPKTPEIYIYIIGFQFVVYVRSYFLVKKVSCFLAINDK